LPRYLKVDRPEIENSSLGTHPLRTRPAPLRVALLPLAA
jgi:hypothetical protein